MPLLIIFRFVLILVSLCMLAGAAYLLWNWYDGDLIRQADGDIVRVRTDWYLWAGAALLGIAFLGRPIVTPLLARRDTDPTAAIRSDGAMVPGASGSTLYVEQDGSADAPPIILVHGWAMDSTIWFYAKRDLARKLPVLIAGTCRAWVARSRPRRRRSA